MSNENTQNNLIGTRIRAARKAKSLNQTELAHKLNKALRTVQKYESGEIEPSFEIMRQISKILECDINFLYGNDVTPPPVSTLADVMKTLFLLDESLQLNFDIEVKRPPYYNEWECSIKFKGKDPSAECNESFCRFLEEFKSEREAYKEYRRTPEDYKKWQDITLEYYAQTMLTYFQIKLLTGEERLAKIQEIINERYGDKES